MNPLLRLLLGSGRLPDQLRAGLAAESPWLLEEGLAGSVAITSRRLLVWARRFKHIDMPLDHPLRATIEVVAERPDRVCFAYDAGATNPSRSGRVEVRLRTAQAERIAHHLAPRPW